jgi:DNA-directed RNA polymerase specialized sigma24 family protein
MLPDDENVNQQRRKCSNQTDRETQMKMIEEYGLRIEKVCGRQLKCPKDREDAVQNVFLKVLRRIARKGLFETEEELAKYMYGAASSAPFDILRKEYGRPRKPGGVNNNDTAKN